MSPQAEGEDESKSNSSPDQKNEEDDKPPDSDLPSIQNQPAGLTVEGDWDQITNFCKQFNYTLKKESPKEHFPTEGLERWKDWHPSREEDQEKVKEKSASHAAYRPQNSPRKDLEKSASHFNRSREKINQGKNKKAIEELIAGLRRGGKGALARIGQMMGKLEYLIYRYVITRTNSSYFDGKLVSANLKEGGSFIDEEDYRIQIKIHDDLLREKVWEKLHQ